MEKVSSIGLRFGQWSHTIWGALPIHFLWGLLLRPILAISPTVFPEEKNAFGVGNFDDFGGEKVMGTKRRRDVEVKSAETGYVCTLTYSHTPHMCLRIGLVYERVEILWTSLICRN